MALTIGDSQEFEIRTSGTISNSEDVLKCLSNLFSTWAGSFPLNRDFGLDWGLLSQPTPDFEMDFTMDVIGKVETYEPRVTVTEVTFEADSEGHVVPTIYIEGTEAEEDDE